MCRVSRSYDAHAGINRQLSTSKILRDCVPRSCNENTGYRSNF
ncbi:MAG: hypothetical protein PWK00_05370 [Coxiella burnetii]|nr:hypothetical protein [Coxiella burnetii]